MLFSIYIKIISLLGWFLISMLENKEERVHMNIRLLLIINKTSNIMQRKKIDNKKKKSYVL